MKTLFEYGLQYMILAGSAALSILVIVPLASSIYPKTDFNVVAPLTVGIIYFLLLTATSIIFRLPWVRGRVDSRSCFIGTYLSGEKNAESVGIFRISYSAWKKEYKLNGTTYSLKTLQPTGSWHSDNLDMDSDGRTLSYIYCGVAQEDADSDDTTRPIGAASRSRRDFDGHGYARLRFLDPGLNTATGHFIDDLKAPARVDSKYTRLNKATIAQISQNKGPPAPREWSKIIEKFAALPPDTRKKFL